MEVPGAPSGHLALKGDPDVVQRGRSLAGASPQIAMLLTDLNFRPTYLNPAAFQVLSVPAVGSGHRAGSASIQARIRSILQAERFAAGIPTAAFDSGRRRYTCRPVLLESGERDAQPPLVALLLERRPGEAVNWLELRRRFRLSRRECETIQHLVLGLTTKEVAQRMSVSPNTVKQFIRLIMTKMAVTTRSGILGKLVTVLPA